MTAATDEMDEIVVTAIKQDNQISNGSSGGGGGWTSPGRSPF